jgi:coatomer protein complex subunit alpha (xenin)
MLKYNTASFTGNVVQKVGILAETGQIPMAYLMAKSHGLTEQAETLE